MVSTRIDDLFREFRRSYRRLIGPGINKTPLRLVLSPLRNELNRIFPTPHLVMLGVTHRCQAKCRHCGMAMYVDNRKDELSTEEVFSLLEEVAKLGTRWIYYFGGEPLLRRGLLELVKYGHNLGLKSRLDTNGYLLSEKMVGDLRRSGLDKIGVSIDDPDPARHHALRDLPGLFEKAIAAIKRCVKENLYCYISTYATKENIENGNLKSLIDLAESLRVNRIRVLFAACCGKFLHVPQIRLSHKERRKILNVVEKPDFVFFEETASNRLDKRYCASLRKVFIYISCHGEVQPCPYVPLSFGSIRCEPLIKIIKRMWEHSLFDLDPDECIVNNDLFRNQYMPKIEAGCDLPANPQ